ncbi:class I SAM-dependent methyltransferase [Metabacillus idriensis]|uniref:Methyltransferase domain-containing protein n=1 Tax=Metabacillus idriensis TaxID=324768 RepID=A0A6I2MBJ2_9BACI|nr:class I SAM-dependent methyltransferase [Metabacillus idriensis]MCM3596874.1 class I SAM-dependent methyltransferase [Metabacillus idriensis]MRX55775.1 methyltransferase domain-containing protein [Metabacillus idriensis]OHR63446.1 methyltransferase [Bacillus sp. HMSC76G11]
MDSVIDYYTGFAEREWTRLDREPLEYIINYHYIKQYLPEKAHILDNGAGPGKYSMALAAEGYDITLSDLTPKLVALAEKKAKELGLTDQFHGFHHLDAADLCLFQDEMFDAALMMGPLYHLQKEKARIKAVQELYRVTKKGGIVFAAFRSRAHHMYASLQSPDLWKPNDSIGSIQSFLVNGTFDHQEKGRFTGAYFYRVEEIAPFMEAYGFQTAALIGSTAIGAALNENSWNLWKGKGDQEFSKLIELLIETAKDPSLLGISSHLLYIGKKG